MKPNDEQVAEAREPRARMVSTRYTAYHGINQVKVNSQGVGANISNGNIVNIHEKHA